MRSHSLVAALLELTGLTLLLVSASMIHARADDGPICVTDADTGQYRCVNYVSTEGGETYSGEWGNFVPHGFGTYVNDELEYVGEFKNGRFHGKGKVTCVRPEHREFEGTFVDGNNLEGRVVLNTSAGSQILTQTYPMCRQ